LDDGQAQVWMPPEAWLSLLIAFDLVCLYWPAHVTLRKLLGGGTQAPALEVNASV